MNSAIPSKRSGEVSFAALTTLPANLDNVITCNIIFENVIREGFKTPSHGKSPLGGEGGYPPFPLTFSVRFFGTNRPLRGGEGVPPPFR